jgi:ribosomal-protein-alanine N-acetyltransferase
VHITNVAVRPNARRQGIARSLLSSVLEDGRSRGFKVVVLEVRPSNRHALRLYESFGFRVVGRRHGYYYDTGEDALVMEIALNAQPAPGNQAAR